MDCKNQFYEGVATHTQIINEKIENNTFIKTSLGSCFKPPHIKISMLFAQNPFPINSFLHTRSAFEEIGGFDEKVNFTEDWQFNVKFILKYNIGILPKILAYYHHRKDSKDVDYGNTVMNNQLDHYEHESYWQNELIRESIRSGKLDFGTMHYINMSVNQGLSQHDIGKITNYIKICVRPFFKALRWVKHKTHYLKT